METIDFFALVIKAITVALFFGSIWVLLFEVPKW